MAKRFNTGYEDGRYSMVSGHLEEGEVLEEAMIREAYEEIAIRINKEDLRLIFVMNRQEPEGGRIDFVFTTNYWKGDIEINEPNKCDDMKWFSTDNLPTNIISYVKFMIDGIINNENYRSQKG